LSNTFFQGGREKILGGFAPAGYGPVYTYTWLIAISTLTV